MQIFKKFILTGVLLLSAVLFLGIVPEATAVAPPQDQINALMQQIAALQAQLKSLQSQQGSSQAWCHTFNKNLIIGDSGYEVDQLAYALKSDGSLLGAYADGDSFDEQLASSVVGFQEKYVSEILSPYGLKRGTGYVGPSTRKKLNALYGCKNKPNPNQLTISPFTGSVGTLVTILGNFPTWQNTGSSKVSYTVLFNNSWIAISGASSIGNKEISFYVPSSMKTNCTGSDGICPASDFSVTPGVYSVSILNPQTGAVSSGVHFTVVSSAQPSITVTSPNGGEAWKMGSSYDIKWDSVGLNKINIELWDTSTNRSTIIARDINVALGKYTWTPGASVIPGDYKITIISYFTENTGISDLSNNSFKITAATTSYNDLLESAKNQLASISDATANLMKSMKGQ